MNSAAINLARRAASKALLQPSYFRNRSLKCISRRAFSVSKLPLNDTHHHQPITIEPILPIAAFVDLDNVAPITHRREDAKRFISPLIQFGRLINGDSNKELDPKKIVTPTYGKKYRPLKDCKSLSILAFGNLATRSYRSPAEKEHALNKQEYIPWNNDEDKEGYGVAQTGYDADGILRCGVCGAKMKLTKNDKIKGRTPEGKLLKHMKRLHDREQLKRITSMKIGNSKKKKLSAKEWQQYRKFQSAQVGLARRLQRSATKSVSRNDLFPIMKEVGVKVKAEQNVDEALIATAYRWMKRIKTRQNETGNSQHEDRYPYRGVLIVYSRDADFVPLLQKAKKHRFITVSMSDRLEQTQKLAENCDISIGPFSFHHWLDNTDDGISSSGVFAEEHTDEDNDFEIRDLTSAPLSLLRPSEDEDTTIKAVPISDEGLNFMTQRIKLGEEQIIGNEGNMVQWDLGTGYFYKFGSDVDVPQNGNEKNAETKKKKLPTIKELHNQHIDRTSKYRAKGKVKKGIFSRSRRRMNQRTASKAKDQSNK